MNIALIGAPNDHRNSLARDMLNRIPGVVITVGRCAKAAHPESKLPIMEATGGVRAEGVVAIRQFIDSELERRETERLRQIQIVEARKLASRQKKERLPS